MIEINVNNKRSLELSNKDDAVLVETLEKGKVESAYKIEESDLVTLLNLYNYAKDNNVNLYDLFDTIDDLKK